jgi:hypothetical protein
MGLLTLHTRIGALALVALTFTIVSVASADVHVQSTPSQNRVVFHWFFPCSSVPSAGGHYDTSTVGRPPNEIVAALDEKDPGDPNNDVLMAGEVFANGDEQTFVRAEGCASAGGTGFRLSAVQPWASVGSEAAPLRFQVGRTVVPLGPDVVTLTYVGGTLQTFTTDTSDLARAALKLIVYPDQATADADVNQDGTGSAFYGAVTLLGGSGTLIPVQGLSAADFTVVNDGNGLITVTPLAGLAKVITVPDANQAVVSMVGDPRVTNASATTGVPGAKLDAGAWLAPASPNPARGATRIRFSVPRDGHVALAVYDQQGRRVRQLVDGAVVAGEHEARWDGLDTRGAVVPSGMYFYRLETDGRLLIGKVLAIR